MPSSSERADSYAIQFRSLAQEFVEERAISSRAYLFRPHAAATERDLVSEAILWSKEFGFQEQLLSLSNAYASFLEIDGDYDTMIGQASENAQLARELGNRCQEGFAWLQAGVGCWRKSQFEEAQSMLLRALEVSEKCTDDLDLRRLILRRLSTVATKLGDLPRALRYVDEGLELGSAMFPDELQADLLMGKGIVLDKIGETNLAFEAYKQCLEIMRARENDPGISAVLGNLGALSIRAGKLDDAIECFSEAYAIADRIDHRMRKAGILFNWGVVETMRGDLVTAEALFSQALEISIALGSLERQSGLYLNLGELALKRYDYAVADSHFQRGVQLAEQLGYHEYVAFGLYYRGQVARIRNERAVARAFLDQAMAAAESGGLFGTRGYILVEMGWLALDSKQELDAMELFEKALVIARSENNVEVEGDALHGKALCNWSDGDTESAISLAKEALEILQTVEPAKAKAVEDWLADNSEI